MNGGSRSAVTRPPVTQPIAPAATMPMSNATTPLVPVRVSFAISSVANTAIAAFARSMPAVRMTSVCPSASVPITSDCCTTSDRLSTFRNVSVVSPNTPIATTSAIAGPIAGVRRMSSLGETRVVIRSAPAVLEAPRGVVAVDAVDRLVGDHGGVRLDEPAGLLAGLRELDREVDALLRHLLRELHDGHRDLAVLHRLDAVARAVDRADDDPVRQVLRLQRRVRATRGRLVDRVDRVHGRRDALQQVLGRLLCRVLLAVGLLGAEVLGLGRRDEAAVTLLGHGRTGRAVEQDRACGLTFQRGLDVLALQVAGLGVVGRDGRVDRVLRVGLGVERDDEDAAVARPREGAEDAGRVDGGEEECPRALLDEVLDGGHLAVVVAVELAGE